MENVKSSLIFVRNNLSESVLREDDDLEIVVIKSVCLSIFQSNKLCRRRAIMYSAQLAYVDYASNPEYAWAQILHVRKI